MIYRSQNDVARWTGVTRAAVSNWIARHDNWPRPDVVIVSDDGTEDGFVVARGWLPERQAEWVTFAQNRIGGQQANAGRKVRRAADMIYQDMQAGRIDATEAARLLRELV